jgi:hypothetical protein
MPGNNIIYNITVKVDKSIADAWLQWMITEHAPEIIATNCFTKFTMLKVLEHDDEESNTYAVQFFSNDIEDYQRYLDLFVHNFSKESFAKWGERFIAFSTIMQVIN